MFRGSINFEGKYEGALAPSKNIIPLPLAKGKGIKGIGFIISGSMAERVGFEPTVALRLHMLAMELSIGLVILSVDFTVNPHI